MIEVEFKARTNDPAGLEDRLSAQAEFAGETVKDDTYFRLPDGPTGHFRIRREKGTATVTTKYKQMVGGTEVNDEIEFEVSDARAFCRLISRFGFEPFVVKRKVSRAYRAGAARIELNRVEHLGDFVEVEVMCEDESQVEAARQQLALWAERLGIQPEAVEPRPYIQLIRERHPVRYFFAAGDAEALVQEEPLDEAGLQQRLW